MTSWSNSFYKTGGTLDYNQPSYVERAADQQLYEQLKQGEFCYILTSRQMGKSSLMVRTALRLRREGESVVTIDLTSFGNTLEQEQWYDSLLVRIGQQLDLETELEEFWTGHERLSPFQRWMEAVHRVVLPKCRQRLILFIDEIDIVRSLKFSADEFFAGIRECYNRRAEEPELNRLVFCLLGVLSPSELIQNADITPFNIGQRIELKDFSMQESELLAKGLNKKQSTAIKLIKRVIYWTGGHPYLTQSLCAAVAGDDKVQSPGGVDRLCRKLYLANSAIEKEDNLIFVRERILQSKVDRAELLNLYQKVFGGKKIADDDANPFINILKLAGLVKSTDGILLLRNRIYRKVFNQEWIRDNMPDAELRRQKAAFRQGAIRTAVIAATVFILAGTGLYWYYDSKYVIHIEYFNGIITRWGVVEGFYQVLERDIPKRVRTYKLYIKDGKVQKYQLLDCYGEPVALDQTETYFVNSSESSPETYYQVEYIYDTNGRMVYRKFLDQAGRFVGGFVFSPAGTQTSGRGYYVDDDGYPKTWGKAEYVNIEWSKEGYERKVLYVDRYGRPQPGRDNAYGMLKEYYPNGLEKRLISLDSDGKRMIDAYGNAIAESIYDNNDGGGKNKSRYCAEKCHGNIVEARFLDVEGKLIIARNNYAIIRTKYDSFDNTIIQTVYNTKNKPVISSDGYFMCTSEFTRDPKEKSYCIKDAFFDTNRKPLLIEGVYHKAERRYYRNGGFAWVYYGMNNQPVSYETVDWNHVGALSEIPYVLSNVGYIYEFGIAVKQDYKEAVRWYLKSAEIGNPWAMYRLGEMNYNGRGVSRDYNEAIKWYRKAADAGDITAMNDLGNIYRNGYVTRQDYAAANKWYTKGAAAGNIYSMENMGEMYFNGWYVQKDYTLASYWYQKAVAAGNIDAIYDMGYMYEYGDKGIKDFAKALEWYRKGAKAGNSKSMHSIGRMYFQGIGVRQDNKKVVYWISKAAKAGNSTAMGDLGAIYERGIGIKKDYARALYWLRKGAVDNAFSMNELGFMYQNGYGVKRDYKEAVKWYQKSAANENTEAMNNLGWMYEKGYGVKKDYAEAVKWYKKGAAADNSDSMNNLGRMYENGYGIEANWNLAIYWYRKAADNGNEVAQKNLRNLELKTDKYTAYLVIAGEIAPGSPARKKGVRKGDIFLEYADWSFFSGKSFNELGDELNKTISENKEKIKHLKLLRGNQIIDYQFPPGLMGITISDCKTTKQELNRVRELYEQAKARSNK